MVTAELLNYIKGQISQGQTSEAIKVVLLNQGWSEADISQAFIQAGTNQPNQNTQQSTNGNVQIPIALSSNPSPPISNDLNNTKPKNKLKYLLGTPILLVIVIIIILISKGVFFRKQFPQSSSLNSLAGFEVLIPKLSNDYYLKNYKVNDKTVNSPLLLVFEINGTNKRNILMSQSLISSDIDIEHTVNLLFKQFSSKEVTVHGYRAFIIVLPKNQDRPDSSLLLTWNDNKRHVNIWVRPKEKYTDEELLNFANELYQ